MLRRNLQNISDKNSSKLLHCDDDDDDGTKHIKCTLMYLIRNVYNINYCLEIHCVM